MRTPIIALRNRRVDRGQHPGLLLQRYLCENATGDNSNPEEKRAILQAAINAAGNEEVQTLYRGAFDRWKASQPKDPSPIELTTQGRLIVGLGSENVLETGIRLHHTYGLPIIPGSALKGLAAHYCDQFLGEKNRGDEAPLESKRFRNGWKEEKHEYHKLLFGKSDDSGCIVFHDAWFVPGSEMEPLKLDVMTPHHSGWNNVDKPEPPTDFDSPIPVPFLSVAGKFLVAVSWQGPISDKAKNWTELALSLLRDALFEWGVGGKTSSGYGRFDKAKWEEEETVRQKEAEIERGKAEQAAALAAMSPIDRTIKKFLENHPDKQAKDYMKLLKELEKPDGLFQTPEDRRFVAARIKTGMQAEKVWKDKEPHGKRKKFIESILGA